MFYITKENGKITSGNIKEAPDGVYRCEKVRQIRTIPQNRLYWWWLGKICEYYEKDIGEIYTTEEMHKQYAKRLLRYREYSEFNKRKYVVKVYSTSDLDTKEFTRYLNLIQATCQEELGWTPPPPINEQELLAWEQLKVK